MSEDRHPAATGVLAAWVLDACPWDEAAAVGEHVEACRPCAGETRRARNTAGLLAAAVALPPPPGLRDVVLSAARRRRAPGVPLVPAEGLAMAYAEQISSMDRLLGSLDDAHWRMPVPRYASVRDLVVHLAGNDAMVAADLGITSRNRPAISMVDPHGPSEEEERRSVDNPSDHRDAGTREVWHAQARALVRGVSQDSRLLEREASLAGGARVKASGRNALVQRTFETWTHADDIRATLGRPAEPPRGEHLRFIVELGTGLLPRALHALGRHHPGRTARLRLTGTGASEWLVPLAPGEGPGRPDVTVVATAEDFCRLLADRIAPGAFPHHADGDPGIVDDLLRAAATLGCD
ncbi:maleylpyruvate isomerase family mycothiol-dependent enzyme [Actinomadura rubrisoli]|uniref:Maleylpyruvate isomerase family mycothiol-dependent enzyme n=1 Tax=Actinomadura rubrisoli TaxID=2530368 RepID=A0A4R5B0F8_9ACTN|nr:maleylpyruvate isomerase family mycothiol-dependent enzyme [Actinomadura rubrisoli]TDD77960.1 maleylpyruvate isomerase family mycothiol-dependent enzyme [Actinomadura rubrisoli]